MRRNKIVNELRRQRLAPEATSQLVNDSGYIDHVDHLVKSVNGQRGDVEITIPVVKRSETFLGTTNASGDYTVVYSTPYSSTPDVQPQIQGGTASQSIRIRSSSVTGFTVNVTNRATNSVLGVDVVSGTATPVSGASVSVLVTAR